MTLLALKREVSINKMLNKSTNPRLRRFDVVVNSFNSCISNTSEKFSRTPEMALREITPKPRMFLHKHPRRISLKKLKGSTNTRSRRKLNKEMDMVSSYVQIIDFTALPISHLSDKKLTIHPESIKLEGVHCIFNFPHEVEGILSEVMLPKFQIHFSSPETLIRNKVLTISDVYFIEPSISAPHINYSTELNLMEGGDSSPNLKDWVSSPQM